MTYADVVMGADYDLAATARAIAEPTRAAMLLRLMDRQSHTARALAEAAGIAPSTASTHLHHLVNAGLVKATIVGRRRLHVIASPGVATAIEAIAAISPMLPAESLRDARTGSQLQTARVCYSHLGGWLAVAITRELQASGVVDNLRTNGHAAVKTLDHPLLTHLHITNLADLTGPLIGECQDWTEGEVHLAGRLGAALLSATLEQNWLRRRPRDRALNVTDTGVDHLTRLGLWPAATTH
ncbi:ArsR/SmtB family transcription factor [Pseudonocardia xinjiangensis]|uniref:ArsR/SmtB family transcription factor n=1 Tax=Pseudonocardia xinjiangensis TaxID=75289 RepID=UPI003D9023F2